MPGPSLPKFLKALTRSSSEALKAELPLKREYLSKIDIFRDLSPNEIHMLEETTTMTTVPKGELSTTRRTAPRASSFKEGPRAAVTLQCQRQEARVRHP
jgi:hypothetical protein